MEGETTEISNHHDESVIALENSSSSPNNIVISSSRMVEVPSSAAEQRGLRHLRAIHARNIQSTKVTNSYARVYVGNDTTSEVELVFKTGILEQSVVR